MLKDKFVYYIENASQSENLDKVITKIINSKTLKTSLKNNYISTINNFIEAKYNYSKSRDVKDKNKLIKQQILVKNIAKKIIIVLGKYFFSKKNPSLIKREGFL